MRHAVLLLVLPLIVSLLANAGAQSPAAQWRQPIIDDPGLNERRELLLSHGVNPDAASMLRFLENGFDTNALPKGLPPAPQLKSEVVNGVIAELGITASDEGVPVLIRIARHDNPEAVQRIIRDDFEQLPLATQQESINRMERLLSLNAIIALGLIGDERGAPVILDMINSESGTIFTTTGAIALGEMGRSDGIPKLFALASNLESDESVPAFAAFYQLTGRNYGYSMNTPRARRRQLVAELSNWLQDHDWKPPIYRADVLRRLNSQPVVNTVDPTSLRGLLRSTMDISDYDKRYAARETLKNGASQQFEQLKSIVQDPMEELDIRRAAMQWLAIADAKKAKPIIRRQLKDENPLVAQMAASLGKDIDEALDYKKPK